MAVQYRSVHVIQAPRQAVWEALQEPAVLRACLPGCRQWDEVKRNTFRATVGMRLTPFLGGAASGTITVTERRAPDLLRLRGRGGGGPIKALGRGSVQLRDQADGTILLVEGNVQLSGRTAGVVERVLPVVGKRISGQFFRNLERVLARRR